jgi:hypothetical protein
MAGKGQAIMLTSLFTAIGVYDTLRSAVSNIINFIIIILIIMVVIMVIYLGLSFTPFVGFIYYSLLMTLLSIFISISVPLALIVAFGSEHMGIQPDQPIPALCFDRDTPIPMANCSFLTIEDVQVGDVLQKDGRVTAKLKLTTAKGVDMYNLYGVFVSGTHLVWYNKEERFIHVCEHPDRVPLLNYRQPFLYSLNTESKRIRLQALKGGNSVFADWDDCKEVAPPDHLHVVNDGGFAGSTCIELYNGNFIALEQVEPNMRLKGGVEVWGVVMVDGLTLEKQFVFQNPVGYQIVGGAHWVYWDPLTKKKTSTFRDPLRITERLAPSQKQEKLYHLITDKEVVWIENILFADYNACCLPF